MSSRATGPARLVLAVATGLLTTACNDAEPTPATGPAHALTEPGSRLAFGEAATVARSGDEGRLRIAVKGIEKGEAADLRELDLPGLAGKVPYYVRLTVEYVSGGQPGSVRLVDYLSASAGGPALDHLTILADYPSCPPVAFGPKVSVGTRIDTCMTFVAPAGEPAPDRVVFDNDDTYETTENTQLTWAQ